MSRLARDKSTEPPVAALQVCAEALELPSNCQSPGLLSQALANFRAGVQWRQQFYGFVDANVALKNAFSFDHHHLKTVPHLFNQYIASPAFCTLFVAAHLRHFDTEPKIRDFVLGYRQSEDVLADLLKYRSDRKVSKRPSTKAIKESLKELEAASAGEEQAPGASEVSPQTTSTGVPPPEAAPQTPAPPSETALPTFHIGKVETERDDQGLVIKVPIGTMLPDRSPSFGVDDSKIKGGVSSRPLPPDITHQSHSKIRSSVKIPSIHDLRNPEELRIDPKEVEERKLRLGLDAPHPLANFHEELPPLQCSVFYQSKRTDSVKPEEKPSASVRPLHIVVATNESAETKNKRSQSQRTVVAAPLSKEKHTESLQGTSRPRPVPPFLKSEALITLPSRSVSREQPPRLLPTASRKAQSHAFPFPPKPLSDKIQSLEVPSRITFGNPQAIPSSKSIDIKPEPPVPQPPSSANQSPGRRSTPSLLDYAIAEQKKSFREDLGKPEFSPPNGSVHEKRSKASAASLIADSLRKDSKGNLFAQPLSSDDKPLTSSQTGKKATPILPSPRPPTSRGGSSHPHHRPL